MLRTLWVAIVVLVVVFKILTNWVGVGPVQSAIQASQLSDDMTATMLVLIALTLAFWFWGERTDEAKRQRAEVAEWKALGSRPLPAEREAAPTAGARESTKCPMCGQAVARDVRQCQYCGTELGE